jgi:1-acyl-sn-glycerol-3-phosphate acyltransferase
MFYLFTYVLLKIYVRLICRVKTMGREHIPQQGPFLLATNHLSAVDPPLGLGLMPYRLHITGMAAMAHRNDFFVGWLMDRAGAVWVRRGESDRRALREALDVLASGRPLGLAPEGTRSRTGGLIEGKTGATFLALKAGVPIVALGLVGTEKIFPSLRRLRWQTVEARISPAFMLPPQGEGSRKEHIQYCTDLIMARLASLLPESYRGVYAGHPLISYWEQLDAAGLSHQPEWKRDRSSKA